MSSPTNFKYSKDHEWAEITGNQVTVGITEHAQKALGDIVFVELPAVGRALKRGETFGVVESIKAVSDLFAPVTGKVMEINATLPDDPASVNRDPYKLGWLIKLELTDTSSTSELMDAAAYDRFVQSLK